MAAAYEYLTLTLDRGRAAWRAFARDAGVAARDLGASGGEVVGLFSPQLGFASNEATAVIRWAGEAGPLAQISGSSAVMAFHRETLTPTARPADDRMLRAGGIYVHRWFTIDGDAADAFVEISAKAWVGFEAAYDAEIFGLFNAAATDDDRKSGQARLLLLTWYASHGVWETSREQTVDPGGLFTKRHEMTRSTVGRSSLRVAL